MSDKSELFWLQYCNQIFNDLIAHILVEYARIPICLKVQFQALEFNAASICNIAKGECTKVRLASFWTDRSKFRTNNFDEVVAVWKLIFKRLENISRGFNINFDARSNLAATLRYTGIDS